MSARTPRWLPWAIAIAGFALDAAAFWPGQMSFDSAYTWWQARGGATSDIAPPILIFVWRALDAIHAGPALVFALHLALFWCGLALIAGALRASAPRTIALMLVAAFAPVPWLLRAHVWTDVGLFSALLFVTGTLATAQKSGRRTWLAAALPVLFYATAVRHNALPAVLPFAAWMVWIALGGAVFAISRWRIAAGTVALCALLAAGTALVNSRVERRVTLWPASAEWDLAAISIASGEMRLPPFMIGPGLDVPELAAAFRDWSIVPMLQNTTHGMRDPFMEDFTPEQLATLRRAWFDAIADHPGAWLAQHWRQARALVGTHEADWPRELIYVDDEFQYRDNPPIARNATALHKALMRAAATLSTTPALAGWPYLAIGLVAAPFAWRRRRTFSGGIALAMLVSAGLYLAPLLVLVPAELRYLGWTCFASVLAACLLFIPRAGTISPATLSSTPSGTRR